MIADWEINGVFLADQLQDRFPNLFQQLREILVSHGVEVRLLQDVRDIWARDYCPIQVGPEKFVQFRYEPDYLKKYPEKRTGREVSRQFRDLGQCLHSEINLDGGNIVAWRTKAILTRKIFRENQDWTKVKLRSELKRLLQVEQLIVVPQDPEDDFGHSDGMVRFVNESTVVLNDYAPFDPDFGKRLVKALRRHRLAVELIPYFFENVFRDNIQSAVGCYTNFLRTEHVIVAPNFNDQRDQEALSKLIAAFSPIPVIPLDCTDLARDGGILNCISAGFRVNSDDPCA